MAEPVAASAVVAYSHVGFFLLEAVDSFDALEVVAAEEEAVVFPVSEFEHREEYLYELLHPFECLRFEPEKRLQGPDLANQMTREC